VRSGDQRVWHHVRYGIDRAVLRRHPPHAEGRLVRYWSPVFPAATGTTSVPGSNTSAEDRRPT
jgi:hypothetical protein